MIPSRFPRSISSLTSFQSVCVLVVRFGQFLHAQYAIAGTLVGRQVHADFVFDQDALDHRVALEKPLETLVAALGFLGALARAESADEFGLLGDIRLLLFVFALLGQFLQGALLDEG